MNMNTTDRDQIMSQVEAKLAADERFRDRPVQVSAQAAEVTLRGDVATQGAKEDAEKLARSVPGVAVVINELVVNPDGDTDGGVPRAPFVVPATGTGTNSGGLPINSNRV